MTVSARSKSNHKQRSITATDDDWNAVKKRADYFGVSISRLVIDTILKKPVSVWGVRLFKCYSPRLLA